MLLNFDPGRDLREISLCGLPREWNAEETVSAMQAWAKEVWVTRPKCCRGVWLCAEVVVRPEVGGLEGLRAVAALVGLEALGAGLDALVGLENLEDGRHRRASTTNTTTVRRGPISVQRIQEEAG